MNYFTTAVYMDSTLVRCCRLIAEKRNAARGDTETKFTADHIVNEIVLAALANTEPELYTKVDNIETQRKASYDALKKEIKL